MTAGGEVDAKMASWNPPAVGQLTHLTALR